MVDSVFSSLLEVKDQIGQDCGISRQAYSPFSEIFENLLLVGAIQTGLTRTVPLGLVFPGVLGSISR